MKELKYAAVVMLLVAAGILASWRDARALPFNFQINRFQVNQNGGDLVNDSFDDGLEPPSGPNGANTYATNGTFGTNDETGGSLALNSAGAEITTLSSGTVVQRIAARLIGNINSGTAAFVEADFAGILPRDTQALGYGTSENYRITLLDTGPNGTTDDFVALAVRNFGGEARVIFFDVSGGTTLGVANIGTLSSEITLRLDIDASGLVTASYDPDGVGTNGAVFTQINGSSQIYEGEAFTRARFEAFSPVPEPGTLLFLGFGLVGLGLFRKRT